MIVSMKNAQVPVARIQMSIVSARFAGGLIYR
jgi:hypothetical protein